jgi:hypothetical protein
MGSNQDTWTTANELTFLQKLGTFREVNTPRKVLLRGYLKATENRHHWGEVNPVTVLKYVRAELGE